MSKRLGGIIGCKDKTSSPVVVTLGQQYNVGEKPTVILYTYINRHAGTPKKLEHTKTLYEVVHTKTNQKQRVCMCVFFPFILDIDGRTSRGHTGGRSHRIFHPPSFCGACLNFSREKYSAIPFPRRP